MKISKDQQDKEIENITPKIKNMYEVYKDKKVFDFEDLRKIRKKYRLKRNKMKQRAKLVSKFSQSIANYYNNKMEKYIKIIEATDTAIELCRLLGTDKTHFIKKQILHKDIIKKIVNLKLVEDLRLEQEKQEAKNKKENTDEVPAILEILEERE